MEAGDGRSRVRGRSEASTGQLVGTKRLGKPLSTMLRVWSQWRTRRTLSLPRVGNGMEQRQKEAEERHQPGLEAYIRRVQGHGQGNLHCSGDAARFRLIPGLSMVLML